MRITILAILLLAACGDDEFVPDVEPIPDAEVAGPDADFSCNVLFLNFEGASLTQGLDDAPNDVSSIITGPQTSPPYRATDPDRATKITTIFTQVRNRLEPRGVTVVMERPTSGDYMMALMGGASEDVGLSAGIGGLSAFAGCDMPVANRIVFAFDNVNGSSTSLFTSGSLAIGAYLVGFGLPTSDDPDNCLCWDAPVCNGDVNCEITDEAPRYDMSICGSGDTYQQAEMIAEALTCP